MSLCLTPDEVKQGELGPTFAPVFTGIPNICIADDPIEICPGCGV